jgi:thiamine-monophosphate kinase
VTGSGRSDEPLRWGEFELIDHVFAPLAKEYAGAFGLKDDVAALAMKAGHQLVLKADSLIESVHFLQEDPPATVGRKALRRALSDLAAKGATPELYLLAIALPETIGRSWLESFAGGLAGDQVQFRIALAGGETSRTPGALTITVTVAGWVPEGRLVRRKGATPGDEVWVTGTIGDAAGGLSLLNNECVAPNNTVHERLVGRFRLPQPRLAFGKRLLEFARSAVDVSDGLLADLGHIAEVSGVSMEIDTVAVPLSSELIALWGEGQESVLRAVSAGDDYEVAFTTPESAFETVMRAAESSATAVTRIGRVTEGAVGVVMRDSSGREISSPRKGYMHF